MWAEEGQGGGRWVDGQPNCWELSEALMLLSTRLRSARQAAHCTAARSTWPCTRHRTVYLLACTLCSGQGSRCPSRLHTILGQSHLGHAVCNPSSVPRHALPRCYAKLSKLSPLQPCSTLFDDPVSVQAPLDPAVCAASRCCSLKAQSQTVHSHPKQNQIVKSNGI